MNAGTVKTGICGGFLMPHPPVLIPEVGKGREKQASRTIASCERVARRVAELEPDTIVVISPHAPLFSDWLFVYDRPVLEGSFSGFGASGVALSFDQDSAFVSAFTGRLKGAGIPGGYPDRAALERLEGASELDHGALVPLRFIVDAYPKFTLACLSSSAFDIPGVIKIGRLLRLAAEEIGRRVCVIASGDMSHRVNAESPYGVAREGAVFDGEIATAIAGNSVQDILRIDPLVRERAAECGYTSLVMLMGALGLDAPDSRGWKATLYSDEAPFGIGYCVAGFEPASGANGSRNGNAVDPGANDVSWHVALATETIARYVTAGTRLSAKPASGHGMPPAGCFVSLKKNGDLRGCIGTIAPTKATLEEEIVSNAIAACSEDYRFNPVREDELPFLTVSVDVLGKSERTTRSGLDPKKYGVIVTSLGKRGLLLPDLEGVDTVDEQLSIACRKGGIDPAGEYSIERFTVTRYH
jgi:MEMO1 family protein